MNTYIDCMTLISRKTQCMYHLSNTCIDRDQVSACVPDDSGTRCDFRAKVKSRSKVKQ